MLRQPAETQTVYADLSERLRALEAARSFASLSGTFAKKQVRDGDYWYFKTSTTASARYTRRPRKRTDIDVVRRRHRLQQKLKRESKSARNSLGQARGFRG